MPSLILIVEDEQDLVGALEFNLQQEGYQTSSALTGKEALERVAAHPVPDLVLLDLMLPDMSGTDVCREIRRIEATRDIPVVILSAKSAEIYRVMGFEVGADDYVTKPFSVRELMLRVRAVLRRSRDDGDASGATRSSLVFGSLTVDTEGHRTWIDDDEVNLTVLEFRLLITLMSQRGRVLTRVSTFERDSVERNRA